MGHARPPRARRAARRSSRSCGAGARRTGCCRPARSRTSSAMRFTNQLGETQRFTIEVVSPKGASARRQRLAGRRRARPGGRPSTSSPRCRRGSSWTGRRPVRYLVRSDRGFEKEVEFLLLGPYASRRGSREAPPHACPSTAGRFTSAASSRCRSSRAASSSGWRRAPTARARSRATTRRRGRGTPTRRSRTRAGSWAGRVRYELPSDVPHYPGMPRPVDVRVADRDGRPVSGLAGTLFAIRPSDTRLNQSGDLTELPQQPGSYRTLVILDEPGAWELRIDARQQALRFVHAARLTVESGSSLPQGARGDRSGRGLHRVEDRAPRRPLPSAPTAASRYRRGSCGTARSGSSAAPGAGRSTRSSTSGDSISTTGSSASSAARSSRRASPGAPSRTSTTTACRRTGPRRWVTTAAARGCTSKASTAPPACGSSRSCRRCCRGVDEVRLNVGSGVAEVTWRPAHTRLSAIGRALDRLGYTPHIHGASRAQEARRAEDRAGPGPARRGGRVRHEPDVPPRRALRRRGVRDGRAVRAVLPVVLPGRGRPGPRLLGASVLPDGARGPQGPHRPHRPADRDRAGRGVRGERVEHGSRRAGRCGSTRSPCSSRPFSAPGSSSAAPSARPSSARTACAARRSSSSRGRLDGDGPDAPVVEVPLAALVPGDRVEMRSGEVVPVDGLVLSGRSSLDNAVLTGEAAPVPVREGDAVKAGATNLGARLVVRVDAAGEETRVGALLAHRAGGALEEAGAAPHDRPPGAALRAGAAGARRRHRRGVVPRARRSRSSASSRCWWSRARARSGCRSRWRCPWR